MDLYVLDALMRRVYLIDRYISLIWTERFQKYGDFQLNVVSTHEMRSVLVPDTYLAMSESNYVMRIESYEDDYNSDGKRILTITGSSFEKVLTDRVAKDSTSTLTVSPQWTITRAPADVVREVYHDICGNGILNFNDIINEVEEGTLPSLTGSSNIPEPSTIITVNIKPDTVYNVATQICSAWDLGFRFLRQDSTGEIFFDVYSGSDRTSGQTTLTPVIFAPQLENLQNTKELTKIDKSKNVAYVFSPDGFEIVYADGVDSTINGLERRILVINASDITSTSVTDVPAALIQRGIEQLAASRTFNGFEGEVSPNSTYVYGKDYNMGDLVEVHNDDGVANYMRVTEQIFACDSTGKKSYPTLTSSEYINNGSWYSWLSTKQWIDFDTDTTSVWSNQP